jgi:hypothetical protein
MVGAVVRAPRDPFVGNLLGDGGIELSGHPGDADNPRV